MAINCANSIKEFMPDAKITLFTEEKFYKEEHRNLFETVTEAPSEYRAKLWCMANTPYDITFYMDVDMEVMHEDFNTVFDQLGSYDMLFTALTEEREYAYNDDGGSNRVFDGGEFKLHGGVCLYNRRCLKFMNHWYVLDKKIRNKEWWPGDYKKYPARFTVWDQFSLWWLTEKSRDHFSYLKIGIFENDARWNYLHAYTKDEAHGEEPIIYHYDKSWSGFNFHGL